MVYILWNPCPLHITVRKRVFAVYITVSLSKTEQNIKFFCSYQVLPIDIAIFAKKGKQKFIEVRIKNLSICNKSLIPVPSETKQAILR